MIKFFSGLILALVIPFTSLAQDTLSLNEAVNLSLQNNFNIQLVRNDVEIAKNNNTIANAGFLPDVTANGSYDNSVTTTQQRFFDGRERNASGAYTGSLNGNVLLNWTIFQGFNMFIAKNTLEELQAVEETQARVTIENTVATVIVTYYDLVAGQMRLKVIREAVSVSKERKDLVEYKLQLGSASMIDVYQARVDLNADSSALLQLEGALRSRKAELNTLLGRDPSTDYYVEDSLMVDTGLQYAALVEKVKSQNSEVILARQNLTLAELNTKYWKSQYFPAISLYGGYNYVRSRSEVGLLQSNLNHGPVYGVRATFNIFNGFTNRRNLANARILRQSSETLVQQAELEVTNNVYRLYTNYESSLQILKLEENNLFSARENFRIASEKFRLGTIDNIELRLTQQKLTDAENRFVNAIYQSKIAETELRRLSGDLWSDLQQ